MSTFMEKDLHDFDVLMKHVLEHLKFLFKNKPLLRKEWDVEDLYQEIAIKYIKNMHIFADINISFAHKANLLRKMANQIAFDKIRSVLRAKRDVTKEVASNFDFAKKQYRSQIELMCDKEKFNNIRSHYSKEMWNVLECRSEGKSWEECARNVGYRSPAALRLKCKRYNKVIRQQLD